MSAPSVARTGNPQPLPVTSAFTHDIFSDIYPPGIERHYWNHARNRIVYRLARRLASAQESILDVGCGTGVVTSYLRRRGLDCSGCDLGSAPPCDALTAPHLSMGIDACDLDPKVRSRVSLILMLDVLEHIERPQDTLASLRAAFPSLRNVLFTVPARMELWTNYDEKNRHYLRYDARSVKTLAQPGRFELVNWAYFFHGLYIPGRIMTLLGMNRQTQLRAPKIGWMHDLVATAFVAERAITPGSWPGSSIHGLLRCIR